MFESIYAQKAAIKNLKFAMKDKSYNKILSRDFFNDGNFIGYVILLLFIILYAYNILNYFWTLPAPSDPLQYLGSAVWKNTWGYWPWLDRIVMAVNLRVFTSFFSKGYEAGMLYIAAVNILILALSMFWAYRSSGFWAALIAGVVVNSSYLMLGWSTYLYPDQTVALYSLLAYIFYFSDSMGKRYLKPVIIAGIFAGFASLSKITGLAALMFFIIYIILKKDWTKLKQFVIGVLTGIISVVILFILLYDLESFQDVVRQFFSTSISVNLEATNASNLTSAYFHELLLSMKYFPFVMLFIFTGAYKNEKSRNLLLMAWSFIALLFVLRTAGPSIPSYIYTAYIFTIVGFSIYLADLLGTMKTNNILNDNKAKIAISLVAMFLVMEGLKAGFNYSPVKEYHYGYNYLTPLDIYNVKGIMYPAIIKKLYSFLPLLILALLVYIEYSRSKKAIILLVVFISYWFSFSNGGLAYKKADFDRKEAGIYYEYAPLLNEVAAKQFSVYITELNKYPRSDDNLLWVYRIFFDQKYERKFSDINRSQYLNEYQVRGNITYISREEDLLSKIRGDQILTDSPDVVYSYFPSAVESKQVTFFEGKKRLFILDVSNKEIKKKIDFSFEDKFLKWDNAKDNILSGEIEKTLPDLKLLGQRGEFEFSYIKNESGNVVRVKLNKSHETEKSEMNFGYNLEGDFGKEESDPNTFITFEVTARSSKASSDRYSMFVQDKNSEDWEKRSVVLNEGEWKNYSITKKIRKGATLAVMGIGFMPDGIDDWIEMKNIKITAWTIDKNQ